MRTIWPVGALEWARRELGLPAQARRATSEPPAERERALESFLDVEFSARHTQQAGNRFSLPFIVLLLMLVSRSRAFDAWTWPPALVLINLCGVALIVAAAYVIRLAAREVRTEALANLDRWVVHAAAQPSALVDGLSLKQLELIRQRVDRERRGAYSPVLQDPAMLAVLIPSGGYGLFLLVIRHVLGAA
jgi:hypothetical protein